MIKGLEDILWASHYAPPSVSSEDLSVCHLSDLNRISLQLHACIALES